ncbi:glycosyltransferase involved in cell wall biosynthesis [Kibdelosporangium banguiense]|uniref:Glycosyltransferase involved in cell wall biosynthesis n=1 Tax=Kibdelosporangium banguiense TaxID=1365924 RepID=A0ABS4TCU0_9PSEU|nr:glycosyltransferase family 4 protein [Kibdelosporangium banguiense]MBP2322243.1 glycosyltransferase involved in cell wall biosynthesis [Kibdelosporangium banguiense]
MRILVYPHAMEIGGSQLNAIQLAGAVRDRGHEVIVLSEPGPLVERVRDLGLEHLEIPLSRRRPSPEVLATLARTVHKRQINVVHGYEWPPVIEAFFGPGLRWRTPVVGTVMSMSVVPFFPRTVPLVVGTEAIREAALRAGHQRVTLLEPPVDTETDHPSVDGSQFRRRHGIPSDEVLVAMICRLVPELKLEGLLMACDAVGELAAAGHKVQLVLVGDGRSREEIEERAAKANAQAGRTVVRLTGEVADPRPAYAAADVIVGQGGSALRGMAFGKPLVVVGEQGFSSLLTPDTAPLFLQQGWYGLGGDGVSDLRSHLEQLLNSRDRRGSLGEFARRLVVERFALTRAAKVQEDEYLLAFRNRPAVASVATELVRSGGGVLATKVRTKYQRWRGTVATDDANARPIVVSHGKA